MFVLENDAESQSTIGVPGSKQTQDLLCNQHTSSAQETRTILELFVLGSIKDV